MILLNGVVGHPIKHGRGLHKGDPLSPLLFVVAINPHANTQPRHFSCPATQDPHPKHHIKDIPLLERATLFVAPLKADIQILSSIFHDFGDVVDLCTNFQ
jgi:hypothetical protein